MRVKRGTHSDVRERWRERLARFQRLGCSITVFCDREGISEPSLFQWRRRLAFMHLRDLSERDVGRVPITPQSDF